MRWRTLDINRHAQIKYKPIRRKTSCLRLQKRPSIVHSVNKIVIFAYTETRSLVSDGVDPTPRLEASYLTPSAALPSSIAGAGGVPVNHPSLPLETNEPRELSRSAQEIVHRRTELGTTLVRHLQPWPHSPFCPPSSVLPTHTRWDGSSLRLFPPCRLGPFLALVKHHTYRTQRLQQLDAGISTA